MTGFYKYRMLMAIAVVAIVATMSVNICYAEEMKEDIWQDGSPRQSRPPEMTPEQMKEFIDGLAKGDKALVDKLNKLREDSPEKFREEVRNLMRQKSGGGPKGPGTQQGPGGREGSGPARKGSGPAGDGPRRGGWSHERMKAEHDAYIKWLEENYPKEAKQLEITRKDDPDNYIRRFWSSRRKYGQIMDLEKRNPELAEVLKEDMALQQSRDKILKTVRDAKGKQLEKITAQLKKIVGRRFDLIVIKKRLKYEELKKRIEHLQKEVAEQEAELSKLNGQKKTQTAERLKELFNTAEKITWQ
ncbi:MAG: hypothetical protein KAS23_11875 [Anaerohalosphaera sp.]|nr:hypothetical protein [Anaerohalosphaera sp.]